MAQNKKVDEYIAKSQEFAKPILEFLREIIFETCPQIEEDIKWGTPHYAYKDDHLLMLGSFKNHCSFSIYKAEFLKDKEIAESVKAGKKFGYMDKLKSVSELPSKKVLVSLIKEAMTINEQGIKKVIPVSDKPKVIETPDYLAKALNADKKAKAIWDAKSDAFRKDYLVWIIDAKTDATRQKRIDQTLEWVADGKGRFWQYGKK
ncbi:YdeI/OmpD-associated family protein [Flavobacterium pedocola]